MIAGSICALMRYMRRLLAAGGETAASAWMDPPRWIRVSGSAGMPVFVWMRELDPVLSSPWMVTR